MQSHFTIVGQPQQWPQDRNVGSNKSRFRPLVAVKQHNPPVPTSQHCGPHLHQKPERLARIDPLTKPPLKLSKFCFMRSMAGCT